EEGIHSDPTRVLSYIIVGVGFLGGGAILHSRRHIRGLTTAAAIWVGAAVGSAAGLGQLALAGIVTLIAFLTLETIPHRMQRRRFSTLPDVPMRPQ
ncbi:MAG: MgtC/SapB family protein, partial [Planctomycetota bacterium]